MLSEVGSLLCRPSQAWQEGLGTSVLQEVRCRLCHLGGSAG